MTDAADDGTKIATETARAQARAALADRYPGAQWGLGCLKNADGPLEAQVFCAAHPEQRLVVKVYAPAEGARARAQAERQRAVAMALPGGAPEVLFLDEARGVLGMDYADGPVLSALWPVLSGPERLARLEEAGRWLAALHATTARPHPFRPKGQIAWLNRLLDWHAEGTRAFPDPEAFQTEVAGLETMAREVRGTPARRAVTHRDLHLSNIVATKGGLVGLDFENAKEDEPLRDLVWLLVDAMVLAPEDDDPAPLAAALARGYGPTGTTPEALLFLQRLFALGIWAATPAAPSRRHAARYLAARRIIGVKAPLLAL